jgi:hypothetical protein
LNRRVVTSNLCCLLGIYRWTLDFQLCLIFGLFFLNLVGIPKEGLNLTWNVRHAFQTRSTPGQILLLLNRSFSNTAWIVAGASFPFASARTTGSCDSTVCNCASLAMQSKSLSLPYLTKGGACHHLTSNPNLSTVEFLSLRLEPATCDVQQNLQPKNELDRQIQSSAGGQEFQLKFKFEFSDMQQNLQPKKIDLTAQFYTHKNAKITRIGETAEVYQRVGAAKI